MTVKVSRRSGMIESMATSSPVSVMSKSILRTSPEEQEKADDYVKATEIDRHVTPDTNNVYGYAVAVPDSDVRRSAPQRSKSNILPRRSSMKGASSPEGSRSLYQRRASMGGGDEIEVHLPGRREPVLRRRSINFDESVKVRKVKPVKSLTKRPEKLWVTDDEMDDIRQQIASIVAERSRYDETHDIDDSCSSTEVESVDIRGLEKLLSPQRTQVKKVQAWDTVLNEQFLQKSEGEFDEEAIAAMYGLSTRRSQREAVRRASKDAEEIAEYLESARQICRRLSIQ